jgi:hypothetical protein
MYTLGSTIGAFAGQVYSMLVSIKGLMWYLWRAPRSVQQLVITALPLHP